MKKYIQPLNKLGKPATAFTLIALFAAISIGFSVIHVVNPDSQSTTVEVKIDLTFRESLPKFK